MDVVEILTALEKGKARLHKAILAEQRRVSKAATEGRTDLHMQITDEMILALNRLNELGRREATKELKRHGVEPAKTYARPRTAAIRTLIGRLSDFLPRISVRVHRRSVELHLAGEAQRAILEAAARIPGALDAASQLVSSAYYSGMGDVFSASSDLIASWIHSAILDGGTCDPCAEGDGTEYPTWEDAQTDFPDGGPFADCDGEGRCRCRLVPTGPADVAA